MAYATELIITVLERGQSPWGGDTACRQLGLASVTDTSE